MSKQKHRTEALTRRYKDINYTAHPEIQEKWVKFLSNRELTEPKMDVHAKGLNFAVAPEHKLVVDFITATVSHQKQQTGRHRCRTQLKVSAVLPSAKEPPLQPHY